MDCGPPLVPKGKCTFKHVSHADYANLNRLLCIFALYMRDPFIMLINWERSVKTATNENLSLDNKLKDKMMGLSSFIVGMEMKSTRTIFKVASTLHLCIKVHVWFHE